MGSVCWATYFLVAQPANSSTLATIVASMTRFMGIPPFEFDLIPVGTVRLLWAGRKRAGHFAELPGTAAGPPEPLSQILLESPATYHCRPARASGGPAPSAYLKAR